MEKLEFFERGMTAPEAIVGIVKSDLRITHLFFEIYPSRKSPKMKTKTRGCVPFDKLLYHNPPESEKKFWLRRKKITLDGLKKIIEGLSEKQVLAVTSKVKLQNTESILHIPMIDFKCDVSPANLERVQEFLKKIGQEGIILLSGKSYHYYGIELLSNREWLTFLGKCLLFRDFVDSRFVGHRLIDGYTALRISKERTRPELPKVISIVKI